MNFLDIRTILLGYIASNTTCLLVVFFLWSQYRRRYPWFNLWLVEFIFQLAAIVMVAMRGFIPDFLSIVVANFFVIAGTIFLYIGLQWYLGIHRSNWFTWLVLAVFTSIQVYFTYIQPDLMIRTQNGSVALLIVCFEIAWLMFSQPKTGKSEYTRFVGGVFATYTLVIIVRIILDAVLPASMEFMSSGLHDAIVLLIYQVLFLSLTFGLFMLVNNGLVIDLASENTALVAARAALKKSEEKYAKAFQNVPNSIIITRASDGRIIEVNDYFYRMTGYSAADVVGCTTLELNFWESPTERARFVNALATSGRVEKFETLFRRKNGRHYPAAVAAEKIVLADEDCFLTVVQDLTMQKRTEEKVRALNRDLEIRVKERTAELETTNRELESFAYSVSHDLRTPLRSINGWSYLLKEESVSRLGPASIGYLDRIIAEASLMGQLIDDLLELSRVTRAGLQRSTFDLSQTAERISTRLVERGAVQPVEFIIQPGMSVNADYNLIEIVLTNLFDNAIKFTAKCGHPRIEFSRSIEGGSTVYCVRDNGVGFDPADARNLYGPFQRLHNQSEFPGTGIGLATVQRIIHRHGGSIRAEAIKGEGAAFYFTLEQEREQ